MFPLLNNYQIDCAGNVGQIFKSLIQNYASPMNQYSCGSCEFIRADQQRIVDVPMEMVWSQYIGLELLLNEQFGPQFKRCPARAVFQDSHSTCTHQLGSYLVLNTESAHVETLHSIEQNVNGGNFSSDLSKVPVKLTVLGKTFVLAGAANHYPPLPGIKIGHYTALCR
ncbi:hypothetical protein QAD02_013498 [Eretmocerus hayati]|uniref:Uncharacterized protein n=1 Tax=Eretmocerus hayati TaxID=131215 RepID=A0ACC2P4G4_9HYME|nr:hypothetical protein QAD02_013498 [Eretmocerus hayati]